MIPQSFSDKEEIHDVTMMMKKKIMIMKIKNNSFKERGN